MSRYVCSALLSLILANGPAIAAEHGEAEIEFPYHVIAAFVGNTNTQGENEFTLGVEYEYRLGEYLGVGGLLDIPGEGRQVLLLAMAYIHPVGDWVIFAGWGRRTP